jgi:hypothetical protein
MSDIPKGGKRTPTKKKSFSLNDYKKNHGLDLVEDKPLTWYKTSKALQGATGLPGFPKGYVSLARGFSNTGKSTSVSEAAVSAQKDGDLVIFIDTENNIGKKRLTKMGLDINAENVMFLENEHLLDQFGKIKDKNRSEASIEDMADCITHFLNLQEAGDIQNNICFIIDSLGSLNCIRSINAYDKGTSDNNMWNAGAFEHAFKYLLNSRIPSSRKQSKPFINTIIGVQKIWLDSMAGGMPVVKHKGGEAFFFGARLIYHHGGTMTHGTKKIMATSKGRDVVFGIESKVGVVKNQIDGDLGGINMEGKLISTPHGFIGIEKEDKDKYKKDNMQYFRGILGGDVEITEIDTLYAPDENELNLDFDTGEISQ